MAEVQKVVIIGSGPGGHSAAVYAGRAMLNPLMYEGFMAGDVAAGGQLTTTTEVENYQGFPGGINGTELMDKMRAQSIEQGTEIITKTVTKVDLGTRPFKVHTDEEEVAAHTIIIATGATAKRLHVPGEERLWQKGISACAVCDGALPIFRGQPLVAIGGGDTAMEESTYLSKFGSKVYVVHRRDTLRASKAMQDRAIKNEKIEFIWDSVLVDVEGKDALEAVRLKNVKTNEESTLPAGGLFYAIGHIPNTEFLKGQVKMDEGGYVITKPGTTLTSVEGVFAAGDVQDKKYRQAITSAGTGCMAALDAEGYLAEHDLL